VLGNEKIKSLCFVTLTYSTIVSYRGNRVWPERRRQPGGEDRLDHAAQVVHDARAVKLRARPRAL
jgi:hypothetical protein